LRGAGDRGAGRYQYIDVEREQFGDKCRDTLRVSVGVALFEHNVASDDISTVGQTLAQSHTITVGRASADPDIAYPWYYWLLRAGRERPSRDATDKTDKFPPPHSHPQGSGQETVAAKLAIWKRLKSDPKSEMGLVSTRMPILQDSKPPLHRNFAPRAPMSGLFISNRQAKCSAVRPPVDVATK
jgi:hypothetical protein